MIQQIFLLEMSFSAPRLLQKLIWSIAKFSEIAKFVIMHTSHRHAKITAKITNVHNLYDIRQFNLGQKRKCFTPKFIERKIFLTRKKLL